VRVHHNGAKLDGPQSESDSSAPPSLQVSRLITDDVRMTVARRLSLYGSKHEAGGITSLLLLRDPLRDIGNRYEILGEPVARGGFADVFKVRDKFSQEIRAAKRVPKDQISDNSLLRRELEMLLTLDHPNVVRLYEWFETKDSIWLIQEMCTGGELLSLVGQCTSRQALTVIRQILLGLAYLHDRGIIHRDVKLENCLFQSSDKDSVVKIIDFGLAGVVRQTVTPMEPVHSRTQTPLAHTGKAGTAIYLAPELMNVPSKKAPKYTTKCDMWSLGIAAYILLTAEHPFWDKRTAFLDSTMLDRIKSGAPDVSGILPETARDLVLKLLQTDVDARITAHEALMHPCMRASAFLGSDLHLRLMTNLRSYKQFRPIQRVVLTVLAYHSKDATLREVFSLLDTDMNGVLSKKEIITGMNRLGILLPSDFDSILNSIDSDGSGEIDFTEFVAAGMSAEQVLSEPLTDSAFSWFCSDTSKSTNLISLSDLEQIVTKEEAEFALKRYANPANSAGLSRADFRHLIEEIALIKQTPPDEPLNLRDDGHELVRSKSKRRYSSDELVTGAPRSYSSPGSSFRRKSEDSRR